MNNPYQFVRLCAWSGPGLLFFALFFWAILGHNVPPISPALDAQAFAGVVRANADHIRIGMLGLTMGGVLYMVWGLAITKVMEQVEGRSNVLSTLQMWGAGMTSVFFITAPAIWLASTLRVETASAEIIQVLHDVGWMVFDITVPTASIQFAALGACVLCDRRRVPVIPKWVGWIGIYESVGLLVLALMPFFKTGAFARDGAINFWIVFPAFFAYMVIVSIWLFKAIPKLETEYAAQGQEKS